MKSFQVQSLSSFLVLALFLSLPIEIQTQSTQISGTITHEVTHFPVYPGVISFQSNGVIFGTAMTSLTGFYSLPNRLASGDYTVYISSNTTQFVNEETTVGSIYIDSYYYSDNLTLDFTLEETILEGMILDLNTEKPIINCTLIAFSFGDLGEQVVYNMTVNIDEKGTFQASIIPGEYYIYIQFWNEEDQLKYSPIFYSPSYYYWDNQQYAIQILIPQCSSIAGIVSFQSDNSTIINSKITINPIIDDLYHYFPGPLLSTTTDASGFFNITVQGDYNYEIIITIDTEGPFSDNYFHSDGTVIVQNYIENGYHEYYDNLVVVDINYSGTVYYNDLSNSFDISFNNNDNNIENNNEGSLMELSNALCFATCDLYYYDQLVQNYFIFTTNANGQFNVRLIPGYFSDFSVIPPTGSNLPIAYLENGYVDIFDYYVSQNVSLVVPNTVLLSGEIYFSDGSYLPANSFIIANTPTNSSSVTNSEGDFKLALYEGSFDLVADYYWHSSTNSDDYFHAIGAYITSFSLYYYNYNYNYSDNQKQNSLLKKNSFTTYDYYTPNIVYILDKVIISGEILNTNGNKVGGVMISGKANSYLGEIDRFIVHSDQNGHFYMEVYPNYYYDVSLTPPSNSNYSHTPVQDLELYYSSEFFLYIF